MYTGLFLPLLQELKLKYYRLMIELCQHDNNYLAICQHYRSIFDTPKVQQEEETMKDVRSFTVMYCSLMKEFPLVKEHPPPTFGLNVWYTVKVVAVLV